MFVRAAMLGILAGYAAPHQETAHVTVAPPHVSNVTPVAGSLDQGPNTWDAPIPATICDIDPSACSGDKSSCAAKTSCSGKAACAGHP